MSILKFSFFINITTSLIFQSCSRLDDSGIGCSKVDSVYYRLDSMAKSLVKIYHAGDTIKLKDSTGVIYYFIAQKPDSGFSYEKDPGSIYTNCPGNDWFLGHYKIVLRPTRATISEINLSVYYGFSAPTQLFRLNFGDDYFEDLTDALPTPPSTSTIYRDSVKVNGAIYKNVAQIRYAYTDFDNGYIYFNRHDGLLKIVLPNKMYYELLR